MLFVDMKLVLLELNNIEWFSRLTRTNAQGHNKSVSRQTIHNIMLKVITNLCLDRLFTT